MEVQHALTYNNSNANKKVIYRTFVTNNYPAVSAGGSFNQIINSGIVHPTGVLIVPFLGAVGYEHFLEQVNLAEQLTSSDFGISTGLINQNYWENSKWYYVNVERGNAADKLTGRNINVSFTNNSNVPVEVMIFIVYSDEITIDVTTGFVTRHKN